MLSRLILAVLATFSATSAFAAAPPSIPPTYLKAGDFAVEVIRDIPYIEGAEAHPTKHKLDLYVPKGHKDFPVLFFIHGGTWKSGDKKIYGKLGDVFARQGIAVVVANYRLSPAVKHPAHIEDVARAFAWTVGNISRYGGRADQIFAAGHSAGAHLVALLATDKSYLAAHKLSLTSIKGVLALSGIYVILPGGALTKIFSTDLDACRQASPLTHVSSQHPPFLLIHADRDYPTLGWMAQQLCKALVKAKGEARCIEIGNRTHVSLMVQVAQEADPTTQAMLTFIAQHTGLKLAPCSIK